VTALAQSRICVVNVVSHPKQRLHSVELSAAISCREQSCAWVGKLVPSIGGRARCEVFPCAQLAILCHASWTGNTNWTNPRHFDEKTTFAPRTKSHRELSGNYKNALFFARVFRLKSTPLYYAFRLRSRDLQMFARARISIGSSLRTSQKKPCHFEDRWPNTRVVRC
jgi:hypothetical protein